MDTHLITPPVDLGPSVAGRTRDEVGYLVVSAVGYVDQRRSLRQLEQVPWTVDTIRARGKLVDVPEPTLQQQAEAMGEIAGEVMAANTPGGTAEYELAVFAPKGNSRLRSQRVRCQVVAPLAGQVGPDEDLGMDAPPSAGASLADADALAATPGMAAVMAGLLKLAQLCQAVPDMVLRHMAAMEAQWARLLKAQAADAERLTGVVRDQQATITQLIDLVDDAGGSGGSPMSAVPPEMVREGLEEVGSTLKAGLMHMMGAPHEAAGLLDAWRAMPADLRAALADPATAAKLKHPGVQAFIANALKNIPEAA